MPAEFDLTPAPVRMTATGKQDLRTVLPTTRFARLVALLRVYGVEGGGSATLRLITGNSNDSYDGWVTLSTFTAATGITSERVEAPGALRYVGWELSSLSAAAVTFGIGGVARES